MRLSAGSSPRKYKVFGGCGISSSAFGNSSILSFFILLIYTYHTKIHLEKHAYPPAGGLLCSAQSACAELFSMYFLYYTGVMLDIKFIRENSDLIKMAAQKKHIPFDVDELLKVDEERLQKLNLVETLRAEQNKISDKVAQAGKAEREKLISEMKSFKEHLKEEEEALKEVMKRWQVLMLQVPNIPDMSVPEGADDADNQEIKKWGDVPAFDFQPKDHIELMENLDLVDFERGTKVSGFRGYFLKNEGAQIEMAIWQYAVEFLTKRGYKFMIAPSLVRREALVGTGMLPQREEDLYKVGPTEYLAGTAEVPVMGYFMDEILPKEKLPQKILAFSPCFRAEAGKHGKDIKGLIRVHELFRLEQVVLCEARGQASAGT